MLVISPIVLFSEREKRYCLVQNMHFSAEICQIYIMLYQHWEKVTGFESRIFSEIWVEWEFQTLSNSYNNPCDLLLIHDLTQEVQCCCKYYKYQADVSQCSPLPRMQQAPFMCLAAGMTTWLLLSSWKHACSQLQRMWHKGDSKHSQPHVCANQDLREMKTFKS